MWYFYYRTQLIMLCHFARRLHNESMYGMQTEVEGKYRELQDLASSRRHRLTDNRRLFEYLREVEEVSSWIKEQEVVAASEDYGTDLEHVQVW